MPRKALCGSASDVAKVLEGGVDGVVISLGGRTSEVRERQAGRRGACECERMEFILSVGIELGWGRGGAGHLKLKSRCLDRSPAWAIQGLACPSQTSPPQLGLCRAWLALARVSGS